MVESPNRENVMREIHIALPDLGLIAGTRAALGVGAGLLVADYLGSKERRAVGWTLVAVGVLTTIPLVLKVFGSSTSRSVDRDRAMSRNDVHRETTFAAG